MILWRCLKPLRSQRLHASFTTLSRSAATRILNVNGIDVDASWRWKNTPIKPGISSSYSPHFKLRVDRQSKMVVFDIQEIVSEEAPQEPDSQVDKLQGHGRLMHIPLIYSETVLPDSLFTAINKSLRFEASHVQQFQIRFALDALWRTFKKFDVLEIDFRIHDHLDDVRLALESMSVDTDALPRQPELQALVNKDEKLHLTDLEVSAADRGLIYAELNGNVGCIVNGAGLAMATNDVLQLYGGGAANFLDTGGQATTDLLVKAFALLLSDPKVKAILVNIFGGLIRCDLIAQSVIRAAKELDMKDIPLVIRLRGTNQEIGQKLIAESGLNLYPANDIESAARKVIALAKGEQDTKTEQTEEKSMKTNQVNSKIPTAEEHSIGEEQDTTPYAINKSTRVIYQGFTGTVATSNAKATMSYGTNIVGGVSPGKGGATHLDRPVFNTVKEALTLKPDATAIFVPAMKAKAAILEAIEAKVPVIVSVAEGIPIHDMLQIHEALRSSPSSRLIGPNCPGIINPGARVRIGIMPYEQFSAGSIGIISKSGTLSYEAVGETTRHGLGQSMVLGIGGDMLPGTSMVEALKAILRRKDTRGIILIGEIGGQMEVDAAAWLRENNKDGKPVVGMIAGHTAPQNKVMGHAGALRRAGDLTAQEKCDILKDAGVVMVDHTAQLGSTMSKLLSATASAS